jgi:hypothetical protein
MAADALPTDTATSAAPAMRMASDRRRFFESEEIAVSLR